VIGTTEGDELFLEAGAVWCDVTSFDEAVAAGHEREALELYGGHLWDPCSQPSHGAWAKTISCRILARRQPELMAQKRRRRSG